MKFIRVLGAAAVAAMALMAFAGTASATTLEVGGVIQTGAVTIEAAGFVALKNTSGFVANECTLEALKGTTSVFTGTAVSGSIEELKLTPCKEEKVVVDKTGTFAIEWIAGTTKGTLFSNGAEVTVPSPFGPLNCKTSNTDLGVLTGVSSGNATIDINALLSCGFLLPSAKLEGTATVSSPSGLGVTQ